MAQIMETREFKVNLSEDNTTSVGQIKEFIDGYTDSSEVSVSLKVVDDNDIITLRLKNEV